MGVIFDPRLGLQGGSQHRDTRTGRFVPAPKEIIFKCKFCVKNKPLDEMRELTRFFPPLTACVECERRMR